MTRNIKPTSTRHSTTATIVANIQAYNAFVEYFRQAPHSNWQIISLNFLSVNSSGIVWQHQDWRSREWPGLTPHAKLMNLPNYGNNIFLHTTGLLLASWQFIWLCSLKYFFYLEDRWRFSSISEYVILQAKQQAVKRNIIVQTKKISNVFLLFSLGKYYKVQYDW